MLIDPLLKPLEEGFSHKTLGDIETACREVLIQAPADVMPFLFIIQQVCFWLRERLDALAPVPADIHRQIKEAAQEPLQTAIHSLEENVDTPSRVHQATALITAYRQAIGLKPT